MFWFYDYYYLILVVPALIIALIVQMRMQSTFSKYSKMHNQRGMTGAQVARSILDNNGLYDVAVQQVRGNLTDHYDPRSNVVSLSDSVYNSTSIAAIGVAAHEVGHAVQHAQGYAPLRLRNAIVGITNIGSQLSVPLIILGMVFSLPTLVTVGVVAFSLVALFQFITLPVEFNASNRAMTTLYADGFLYDSELEGARKVLSAAAMTYVAALITSVAQLARLMMLSQRRKR